MRFPSFLYGTYADVTRACGRVLTALGRGTRLEDCVEAWIELPPASGLIVMDGPSPLMGGGKNIHAFALTSALFKRQEKLPEVHARWFEISLEAPWSALGLLSQHAYPYIPDERLLPLLDRLAVYWPELDAVGARYTCGSQGGKSLWAAGTKIMFALSRQGLPTERFRQPIGAGGLAAVMRETPGGRIRGLLADGRVDEAEQLLRRLDGNMLAATAMHFLTAGHGDRAVAIVREAAARQDPHGTLAQWLARHAESPATVLAAFRKSGGLLEWRALRRVCGKVEAERVLEALAASGELERVFFVRLWERDARRALEAWDRLPGDRPGEGIAESLAELVTSIAPARAAELYLAAASAHATRGTISTYRHAAALVRRANDLRVASGDAAGAAVMTTAFRRAHARRRRLIAALDAALATR